MAAVMLLSPLASPSAATVSARKRQEVEAAETAADSGDEAISQLRKEQQAKREAALQRRRGRHRAVPPLNGVGLHHLLSLSDRDWRRWPLSSREHRTNGSEHMMVFTEEDFYGSSSEGWSTASSTSGCTTDDGELSDDWEDPLWVKDENVRTAGKCPWALPREPAMPTTPRKRKMIKKSPSKRVVGMGKAKTNKTIIKTKEEPGQCTEDEAESLNSSNESVSWIIDHRCPRQPPKQVDETEPEEQDAEEEDQRARARGMTGSSANVPCERGVEYLLQKYYYSSLPVLPTRVDSSQISAITLDQANEEDARAISNKPTPSQQAEEKSEEKTKVPSLQGSLFDSSSSAHDPAGSRGRRSRRNAKSKEKLQAEDTLSTSTSSSSSNSPTVPIAPASMSAIKNKAGRHLINMFNLSPRKLPTKRSSAMISRRELEEEMARSEQEMTRNMTDSPRLVKADEGESDTEDSWLRALHRPSRRKRSISIPLSAFRQEMELSRQGSEPPRDGSSGKSSFTKRLRRRGGGGAAEASPQPKGKRQNESPKKFNTISSMINMRKHSNHE